MATQDTGPMDATIDTTTRVDGKFKRTAVVLKSSSPESQMSSASIDIVRPDGTLLCRLNLFAGAEGWGDVDVILTPDTQVGRFLAFKKGKAILDKTFVGNSCFTVDIRTRVPRVACS